MTLDFSYDSDGITLRPPSNRAGLLRRLLSQPDPPDLADGQGIERDLAFAIADLRALADDHPGTLRVDADRIRISHELAALVDSATAATLGLPPLVDLVLRTDAEGQIRSPSFRLRYEWVKHGRKQQPKRIGAILQTADGDRRLPAFMVEAIEVADAFGAGADQTVHWEALSRFRQALEGSSDHRDGSDQVAMTQFLEDLEVHLADRFSLAPVDRPDGLGFDVVPYSGRKLDERVVDGPVSETDSELSGAALSEFQTRFRERGALNAYRIDRNRYLVVDRAVQPALRVMATKQRASPGERAAFVRNPRPAITDAMEAHLKATGRLAGLTAEGEQEAVDAVAEPVLVESREYSERVIGKKVFEVPDLDMPDAGQTTWMPEDFHDGDAVETLRQMDDAGLEALCDEVEQAIASGAETVQIGESTVPATPATLRAVQSVRAAREREGKAAQADDEVEAAEQSGPVVLDTKVNFDDLAWQPAGNARVPLNGDALPDGIRATLKDHQAAGFRWQVEAWKVGLPGVLNADEQGLGKTLQTLVFLRWLGEAGGGARPVLVVAPTSLLPTWKAEVKRHLEPPGLGSLIPLFGAGLGGKKRPGARGIDTQSGEAQLDLSRLKEAIDAGKGGRFWLLTTYTTLTNYQHSLGEIDFAAIVFDEIQALKNPGTLRAFAARAMKAEFRIGLTGTPIENRSSDLWAIMDQLCPGALDTLGAFNGRYGKPDQDNMRELHGRVFEAAGDRPAIALRRTKDKVAKDLPTKTRRLHPREMPDKQAAAYDAARLNLGAGMSKGAALRILHHMRTVSAHPELSLEVEDAEFIAASARLDATFAILRRVRDAGERALVFIEHVRLQYRFKELARYEFGLPRIELINGSTPIVQRQQAVERFQRHLDNDGGFDLMVLGTRAAGTGLTLTAATHVIHVSRWWNPAVEEQCNDRVHRIGQTKPVSIHVPMAIHAKYREQSFDCLLQSLMNRKRRLATSALWPMADNAGDANELERGVAQDAAADGGDAVEGAMAATFERDGKPMPPVGPDRSFVFD